MMSVFWSSLGQEDYTHVNRHLVHMNTLLDAKFRNQDIKGSIQNIDNLCLTDHWTIAMSEVGDQDAKEEMS